MKRYQNTLRLAIVVRCVAIAPTASNLHAMAPRCSEAVLRCVMPVLPVLGWAEERAASAFHGCHGTVNADGQSVPAWYRYSRRMEVRHRLVLMSASGALVRNRRDCARSPLQPPGKTAAPDHGFIRAAAGAACMRTLPWAPPAPLCISISAQLQSRCWLQRSHCWNSSPLESPEPLRLPFPPSCSGTVQCSTCSCTAPAPTPALHQADPLSTHASRPRAETYAAPFRPPTTGALHSALHVLRLSPSCPLICSRDA
jgi:hypothetical protein